jgi:hypothetical protein
MKDRPLAALCTIPISTSAHPVFLYCIHRTCGPPETAAGH